MQHLPLHRLRRFPSPDGGGLIELHSYPCQLSSDDHAHDLVGSF
jgi:hypothetical protein